jgi:fibronectin type 3 domain-containing protein
VSSGHHSVVLSWPASTDANYYRVYRSTLHSNNVGGYYVLRTIMLNDQVPGTTFTDTTPTDGKYYRYSVDAVSAGGSSAPSNTVDAHPLPPPPDAAPGSLAGSWTSGRQGAGIKLSWQPVPGATGYVIYRSDSGENFKWPDNFVTPLLETTYTDTNKAKKKNERTADHHIDPSKDYYYQVTAINAGGISPPATVNVPAQGGG